jgi:hypothetical protein
VSAGAHRPVDVDATGSRREEVKDLLHHHWLVIGRHDRPPLDRALSGTQAEITERPVVGTPQPLTRHPCDR